MKYKTTKILIVIFISIIAVANVACHKKEKELEKTLLHKWLDNNEITVKPRESGLYYIQLTPPVPDTTNLPKPAEGDTVILTYKGYLLADTSVVIDQQDADDPLRYVYLKDNVIEGWEEGIGLTHKGVTAQLVIPSKLAYGAKPTGIIPPYSTLIFDIHIIDIKQ